MELINETIGKYIDKVFNKFQEREALIYVEDKRRFTFRELKKQVDNVAKSLITIGVKKGDHIALLLPNSPEWIIIFLASLKIGAVSVFLNPFSTEEELEYMLKQSDSSVLIMSNEVTDVKIDLKKLTYIKIIFKVNALFELSIIMSQIENILSDELKHRENAVSYNDMATILYTSGTTGKPKGVMFSHKAVLNGALSHIENFHYTEKDKILVALPLHHIMGGKYTALLGLLAGSTIVLMKKFHTSEALKAIESEKCTGFHGVPTMYQYLLNKCDFYDLSSLRVGMVAGAVSSHMLIKNIMEKLHITELNHTFGQTETLGVTQTPIFDKNNPKLITVGKPVDHVEVKICDLKTGKNLPLNTEGELCVKSPYSMLGYYNNHKATKDTIVDGWVHTGDIAFIDEEGYISIKGRLKDVIIRGGETISPADIENHIVKHPEIEVAVIVGVPDEILGEEIFAFIKVNEGSTINKDDILNFLLGKISKYKFPKYIEFIDNCPLTPTGKIKRNLLKQNALERIKLVVLEEIAITK